MQNLYDSELTEMSIHCHMWHGLLAPLLHLVQSKSVDSNNLEWDDIDYGCRKLFPFTKRDSAAALVKRHAASAGQYWKEI